MSTVRFQMWSEPSALAIEVIGIEAADGEVVATLDLSPEAWMQVDAFSFFHLDPDAWEERDRFDDERGVRMRARLDADLAADLPDDGDALLALMVERDAEAPEDPLLDTASWTALDVTQDVELPADAPAGTLRQGIATAAARGTPLLDVVTAFLDGEGLGWERAEAASEVTVPGGDDTWSLVVRTLEDVEQIVVAVRHPSAVPAGRRAEVMELVTRLNVDLTVVWFELDLEIGTVSAQTGLSVAGIETGPGLVAALVRPAVAAFERFLPALEAVAAGEVDVADL